MSVRVKGLENLPEYRQFILAPNHQNNFDPPIAAYSIYPKECFFLAKNELFSVHPLYSALLRMYNSIKINRTGRDISAIKKSLSVLKKGYVLIVFPEGTRKIENQYEEIKFGAAFLALKTKCPLVPCLIKYGNQSLIHILTSGTKVEVFFGKPIYPSKQLNSDAKSADAMAEKWKKQMRELCR